MKTHSIFRGSFSLSDWSVGVCDKCSRHTFQVTGSERISAIVLAPTPAFNSTDCSSARPAVPPQTLQDEFSNDYDFDVRRAQPAKMLGGNFAVGYRVMNRRNGRDE